MRRALLSSAPAIARSEAITGARSSALSCVAIALLDEDEEEDDADDHEQGRDEEGRLPGRRRRESGRR